MEIGDRSSAETLVLALERSWLCWSLAAIQKWGSKARVNCATRPSRWFKRAKTPQRSDGANARLDRQNCGHSKMLRWSGTRCDSTSGRHFTPSRALAACGSIRAGKWSEFENWCRNDNTGLRRIPVERMKRVGHGLDLPSGRDPAHPGAARRQQAITLAQALAESASRTSGLVHWP